MITSADQLAAIFRGLTAADPDYLVQASGRANIIGEHTDYNDGFVMPGAIDRYLFLAARPNGSGLLRLWALDIDEQAQIDLQQPLQRQEKLWLNYVLGIADQFASKGYTLPGLDIVFGGNLPIGAGVSSSAALETGMATIWNAVLGAALDKPSLALLAQRSSHQFVGIPCGIMDQYASLMGVKDQLILLDCRSLEAQMIPADTGDYGWVLLNTCVHHSLAESAYPVRVRECRDGLAAVRQLFTEVLSLRDTSLAQLEAARDNMSTSVYNRSRYVVEEVARTLRAADCLRQGELRELGDLMFRTHEGLRHAYEVSCEELDFLVEFAAAYPGVLGSRLMGGGFGGCTISLVHKERINDFAASAMDAYLHKMNKKGEILFFSLVEGTRLLNG